MAHFIGKQCAIFKVLWAIYLTYIETTSSDEYQFPDLKLEYLKSF